MQRRGTVLFLTIGGTHEPAVKVIRQLQPERVIFFCSGDDPGTGRRGSWVQITGQGKVIKARKEDPYPTLPNIPTQCGLTAESCKKVEVPPDHLDGAFEIMAESIDKEVARDIKVKLVADYTGGTKTMSTALVLATLEHPEVDLNLTTGNRSDLTHVHSGTEHVTVVTIERLRTRRMMKSALSPWERYAYDEAEQALERIATPSDPDLAGELNRLHDLSHAFSAWDHFNHDEAFKRLDPYAPVLASPIANPLALLSLMANHKKDPARAEALLIWDLWLNAKRRAAAGRFDDAVARLYRVIEWTAQWLLSAHLAIDTSDVPLDKIPSGITIEPGREGSRRAGLFAAWQLLAHHRPQSEAGRFFAERRDELLDLLKKRNGSILAHGFKPVGKDAWEGMHQWVESNLCPVLCKEAKDIGQKTFFDQLPRAPTEALADISQKTPPLV